jgi:hypothetical protein
MASAKDAFFEQVREDAVGDKSKHGCAAHVAPWSLEYSIYNMHLCTSRCPAMRGSGMDMRTTIDIAV